MGSLGTSWCCQSAPIRARVAGQSEYTGGLFLGQLRVDFGAARVAMPRCLLELVERESTTPPLGQCAVLRALVHSYVRKAHERRRALSSEAQRLGFATRAALAPTIRAGRFSA
jgi:hypothetical protein